VPRSHSTHARLCQGATAHMRGWLGNFLSDQSGTRAAGVLKAFVMTSHHETTWSCVQNMRWYVRSTYTSVGTDMVTSKVHAAVKGTC